jgi:hypothetical protein
MSTAPPAACGNAPNAAAVIIAVTVSPVACVVAVVDSAPRVTVHVVPATAVTIMSSVPQITRNCDVPATGVGNPVDDATVNVVAPAVIPAARVVAALFANSSVTNVCP